MLRRLGFVIMTMLAGSSLFFAQSPPPGIPARLAIYYGYPSLVNGAHGDAEKAASVFSGYDVVVIGDGLEFPDKQPGRYPEGDPAEHQKALQIIAAVGHRSPGTRFYGYVCLGDIPSPGPKKPFLEPEELKERIRLWKQMGVAGIFLDEAGYEWPIVDRKRQNVAIQYIHELGLSAFPNAFYPEELFSLDNLRGKNPHHLPPLLDKRDLFLLESFQVKSGAYEDPSEWQGRLRQALDYRRQYGSRIFVTTTGKELCVVECVDVRSRRLQLGRTRVCRPQWPVARPSLQVRGCDAQPFATAFQRGFRPNTLLEEGGCFFGCHRQQQSLGSRCSLLWFPGS